MFIFNIKGMVVKNSSVPIESRYAAAAMEISARLQSRQNVNLYLTTVAVAGIAATWTQNNAGGILAAILLGAFSYSFALWISHNDLILGLLGKFCETCESSVEKSNSETILPSWFGKQGWLSEAFRFRKLSDWGTIVVLVVSGLNALLKAVVVSDRSVQVLLVIAAVGSGASVRLVYGNERRRLAIRERSVYSWKEGKYKKF